MKQNTRTYLRYAAGITVGGAIPITAYVLAGLAGIYGVMGAVFVFMFLRDVPTEASVKVSHVALAAAMGVGAVRHAVGLEMVAPLQFGLLAVAGVALVVSFVR